MAAACLEAEDGTLLAEARFAVQQLAVEPISTRFDESGIVVLPAKGLVCDGRVNFTDEDGRYVGFQSYYFRRGQGVALADHDPELYVALMRECHRARR